MSLGTFEVPDRQVKRLFENVAASTGQSTVQLLNHVMELWAKDLIRQTYPVKRAQGMKAVAADVYKIFSDVDSLNSEPLKAQFRKRRDFDLPSGVLHFRPRMKIEDVREIHEGHRNRRGRVPRRVHSKTIVGKRILNRYIRERQKGIGKLKAGWSAVAERYSLRLPAWVARHGRSQSAFYDDLNRQTLGGSLTAENRVDYADILSGQFMDWILNKRVRDLTSGTYAKRWEKQMAKGVQRGRTAA